MLIYVTDEGWREMIDAEIAQHDTAEERFGLMLSAMVGGADMAQLLDTVDYEQDVLDREWHSRGMW